MNNYGYYCHVIIPNDQTDYPKTWLIYNGQSIYQCVFFFNEMSWQLPSGNLTYLWKITMFKLPFSIALLVYRRVTNGELV